LPPHLETVLAKNSATAGAKSVIGSCGEPYTVVGVGNEIELDLIRPIRLAFEEIADDRRNLAAHLLQGLSFGHKAFDIGLLDDQTFASSSQAARTTA
jgi:hypothetical protein